jgi:hypothetical protein
VYYSGSLDAFTFNDEGHEKGFIIHDINVEGPYHDYDYPCRYIGTPAREFITDLWDNVAIEDYWKNGLDFGLLPNDCYKDAVVRVLYTCDSDTEKVLDKKKLERDLYNAGAYYVSEIRLKR